MATAHSTIQKQLNQYLNGELKLTRTAVDMMFMRLVEAKPELWAPIFTAYLSKGRLAASDEVETNDNDPFGGKR
jgi:hypothetical protein